MPDTKLTSTDRIPEIASCAEVEVDDIEYLELPKQMIVALISGSNVSVQNLSSTGNAILETMSQGLDGINVADLESLFLK